MSEIVSEKLCHIVDMKNTKARVGLHGIPSSLFILAVTFGEAS